MQERAVSVRVMSTAVLNISFLKAAAAKSDYLMLSKYYFYNVGFSFFKVFDSDLPFPSPKAM